MLQTATDIGCVNISQRWCDANSGSGPAYSAAVRPWHVVICKITRHRRRLFIFSGCKSFHPTFSFPFTLPSNFMPFPAAMRSTQILCGLWGVLKAPQRGSGQRPGRKRILYVSSLKRSVKGWQPLWIHFTTTAEPTVKWSEVSRV